MEYKVKRKYLGKVLKGGGISITLSDDLSPAIMRMAYNRFGKEYFTTVKKNDKNTESTSEQPSPNAEGKDND
jgi:hypothetical protein